jgi:hypothetical protein
MKKNDVAAITYGELLKIMENPCKLVFDYGSDLETKLELNQPEMRCFLERKGTAIIYDQKRFGSDPASYFSELAKAQEGYKSMASDELHNGYIDLDELIAKNSEIRTALEFIPDDSKESIAKKARFFTNPLSFIKSKSLDSMFEAAFEAQAAAISKCSIIQSFFEYGQTFLERNLLRYSEKLTEDDKKKLEECMRGSKDLTFIYTRMMDTGKKFIRELKELRSFFYPSENNE